MMFHCTVDYVTRGRSLKSRMLDVEAEDIVEASRKAKRTILDDGRLRAWEVKTVVARRGNEARMVHSGPNFQQVPKNVTN